VGTSDDSYCNQTLLCNSSRTIEMAIANGTCNNNASHCFVNAWCPMENQPKVLSNFIEGVVNFTAFAKVNVLFPSYGIKSDNTNGSKGQLTPGFNLWSMDQMVQLAGTTFDDIKRDGAILLVTVEFDCDFDHGDRCVPNFHFDRIDTTTQLSKGFNFRYPRYYWIEDGSVTNSPVSGRRLYRDLHKVYGLRVIFLVAGQGAKFSIVPLVISLASGLALLSVASVVCDFLALYVLPEKKIYMQHKYEDGDEPQNSLDSQSLLSTQN